MLSIGPVLTVEDIERAGAFWRAALGYVNRREPSEDWVILDPPAKTSWDGPGASIALSVTEYPQHYPPRIHLDLYATDQAAEIQRLLALGAREVDWHGYPEDADYVVLEDTEGNRFCVVDVGDPPMGCRRAPSVLRFIGSRCERCPLAGCCGRATRRAVDVPSICQAPSRVTYSCSSPPNPLRAVLRRKSSRSGLVYCRSAAVIASSTP